MRKPVLITIACCLLAGAAAADVVWMQNGKSHEGKVTRDGDIVIIAMRFGTIRVHASEVRRIVRADVITKPKDPDVPQHGLKERPFDAGRARMPESVVFLFMRRIAASANGLGTADERHQVQRWRDAAHDRLRKIGGQWVGAKEFEARRKAFDGILKEAVAIMRQRSRIRTKTRADRAKRLSLTLSGAAKMKSAAVRWPDPLLRTFMTGISHYEAGAYLKAAGFFKQCAEQAPLIAAFHQGCALSLVKLNRAAVALPSFITALQLAPDSKEALQQLRDGMKAVPGTQTHTDIYEQAKAMSAEYRTSKSSSSPYGYKGVRWILPGKVQKARDNTLPVPTYHRLVFHQATGVAIGKHALLADTATVAKADIVIVRIGDKYVPARIKKSTLYWRGKGDPPVTLVTVNEYSFTPVSAAVDAKFAAKDIVTAHSMNFFAEMGPGIRKITGPLKWSGKGPKQAKPVLLRPGDSAGPVVTGDNRLVGFLAAKTDVRVPDAGPDRLWTLTELKRMIERGATIKPAAYYWATKRTITVKPAEGTIFEVYGVFCETLKTLD